MTTETCRPRQVEMPMHGTFEALTILSAMVTQSQKGCLDQINNLCQGVSRFVLQNRAQAMNDYCVNRTRNILSIVVAHAIQITMIHESSLENYNSFFSFRPPPSPPLAPIAIFCLPCPCFDSFTNTNAATTAAPTSCTTVAQAIPHI